MKQYITFLLFTIIFVCPIVSVAQSKQDEGIRAANRFFQNGEILKKSKQYAKAIEEYDHAIIINENFYRAYYSKGICYYFLNDTTKASEDLEKSVSLKSDFLKGYIYLVKIYAETQNLDMLINTYDRMILSTAKQDRKVSYQLKVAKLLLRERQYHKAHKYAKEAVEISTNNYDALYYDALYYDAKINNLIGNYEIAEKDMHTALEYLSAKDPKVTAKLYYELGLAYHQQGKYQKSSEAFEKAKFGSFRSSIAKLQPNYFYRVASGFVKVYDLDKAKEILNKALIIDPHYSNGNKLLGEIAIKKQHYHRAIHHYKKAINGEDDRKEQYSLYIKIIEIEINSNKYADAIKTIDECLQIFPNNKTDLQFMKAIALSKHAKLPEGIAIIENLLINEARTQLELVKFNFSAGMMYLSQKEYNKATEAFKKARKGPFANAAQYEMDIILQKMAN